MISRERGEVRYVTALRGVFSPDHGRNLPRNFAATTQAQPPLGSPWGFGAFERFGCQTFSVRSNRSPTSVGTSRRSTAKQLGISSAPAGCCERRHIGSKTRCPNPLAHPNSSVLPRCRSIGTLERSPGIRKEHDSMGTLVGRRLRRRLESRIGRIRPCGPGGRRGEYSIRSRCLRRGRSRKMALREPSGGARGSGASTASHPTRALRVP